MKTEFENPHGLHQKYYIQKIVQSIPDSLGKPSYYLKPIDNDAEYFVLRLDKNQRDKNHLKACLVAINAYADEIKKHLPQLSDDLKKQYPVIK